MFGYRAVATFPGRSLHDSALDGMNVFSTDTSLRALAVAHGTDPAAVEIVLARAEGSSFRTVVVDGSPLVSHPFVDFFEPVDPAAEDADSLSSSPLIAVRYLPRVARRSVPATEWPSASRPELDPAPFVRWSAFDDWATFERAVAGRRKKIWSDSRRCTTRLVEEAGEVTFVDDDPGADAWDACLRWKSDQYSRTGATNGLTPTAVRYLTELRDRGVARVSTLRAGGACIAAHIGLHADGRQYYWLPAYDAAHERHSPGRLLLHHLMRASFERGDIEFDLLFGDEPYKWWYATDARIVEPLGAPGLTERVRQYRRTLPRRHPALQRRGRVALRTVRRLRTRVGRRLTQCEVIGCS